MAGGLVTLKTRADFLRVAGVRRSAATPGLVLQAARRQRPEEDATVRVGFTASRKVGNAVERNHAKRRLRAVAAAVLPRFGRPGTDYVLIARGSTGERPFAALLVDLETALRRLNSPRTRAEEQANVGREGTQFPAAD